MRLLLFLVVVAVGVSLWLTFRRSPIEQALVARELATRKMGEELARRYPGSRALVISNPFAQKGGRHRSIQAVEEAGIAGLKRGFGERISIGGVVFPGIRPEAEQNPRAVQIPSTTTPLSYLVAEDSFDRLAEEHPECDLIVSLIGLPAKLEKVRIWQTGETPRFALLLPDLRMVGSVAALKAAVESGKLPAFVMPKRGAPPDQEPLRGGDDEEFARRFILVTAANIAEVLEEYADRFKF